MTAWRPVVFPRSLSRQLSAYKYSASIAPRVAHRGAAERVLSRLLQDVLSDILDREGLPHIAHLICGWGNAKCLGRPLFHRIQDFIVERESNPRILQCDQAGDFHPWQTFAY